MDGTRDTAGEPVALRLVGLRHELADGTLDVGPLDLEVPRGAVQCLLGRPGSGGSTVLRLVNRLVEPTGGGVELDGQAVSGEPPEQLRRRLGFVTRSGGLLPHRDIADNLATVPRLLGWKRARVRSRVDELLDLIGLEPGTYRGRYPAALAADERALVALARALAAEPPVLLADEPFADVAVDDRPGVWARFRAVLAAGPATVLFATSDVEEALAVSDRVAVLSAGAHLEQNADPATLLADPATDAVAELLGDHRGLRRLGLTPLRATTLGRPATVRDGDRPSFASARLASVGAGWAVVVEPGGTALGWVGADDLLRGLGHDTLEPLVRPLPGTATLDESALDVLARVLVLPEGWVAVLDGPAYVGIFDRAGLPDVHTDLARTGTASSETAGA